MIEIPRAALTADQIATEAEFFSFGTKRPDTDDLWSVRDDAGKILADYIDKNIYEVDPTARLDRAGVGLLMQWAVERQNPFVLTSIWVSAANTAAILILLNSATRLVWTMYPALPTAYLSQDWLRHRHRLTSLAKDYIGNQGSIAV